MDMHHGDFASQVGALKGALAYALFGVFWIYFSDAALAALVTDPGRLTTLQTYKGWFFILITAALVYSLLHRHGRAVDRSREQLQKSEMSLELLFRALPVGAGTVNRRVLATVNERLCEITGYPRDEMVGRETRSLYVDDAEFERVGRILYHDTAEKGFCFLETLWRRKDGQVRNVLLGVAVAREGTDPTDVVLSAMDVTEQREQEALYRLLFEGAYDALFLMDGRSFMDCNSRALEMYGARREQLVGASPLDFSPRTQPDGRDSAEAARARIAAALGGEPQVFEWLHQRLDGAPFHAEISLNRIDRGGGEYLLAIVRDITARKEDEAARRKSEAYLSSIFRAAPVGIGVLENRVMITVNDRFCEISGYAREELEGESTRKLYASEEEFQRCGREIYGALKKGETCGVEACCRRKDGQDICLLLNAALLSPGGDGQAVTFSVLDITGRRQVEEELRRSRDTLEDVVRERTREFVDSNAELQRLIAESEDRSVQASVLNDMGELLQACETEDETYQVVGGVCAKLFPEDSGCIGILDEADWSIKVVSMWGEVEDCRKEFAHNDCWAIRRGKAHVVLEPDVDPLCNHVGRAPECGTLCVPMGAQGRVLGMAYMLLSCNLKGLGERELRRVVNDKRILLSGVVERYAPSLVNLRLRETLREQSIRDRLTGLFNRRHMEEALRRELARARRRSLSLGVIMIDVDHFKRFNDTYGHETGDAVLRALGRFLLASVRAEDIPCRYGGEELLLILPDSRLEDSVTRAEDLRRGIEREVAASFAGERLQVTASLGVAAHPAHGQDVETLLAAADAALYQAKENGRNTVVAYAG